MELKQLTISGLHGCYDYDVRFNSDMTFLYGTNGCGKTTVLNIIESIITGELFKLFDYNFRIIELIFYNDNIKEKIYIEAQDGYYKLYFDNRNYELEELYNERVEGIRENKRVKLIELYFKKYPVLKEIRKIFNYIYLPLNRKNSKHSYQYIHRLSCFGVRSEISNHYLRNRFDDSFLDDVSNIIKENYRAIALEISGVNDKFRNDVLKSFLKLDYNYNKIDVVDKFINNNELVKELQSIQTSYVKMLKELMILDIDGILELNQTFSQIIQNIHGVHSLKNETDALVDFLIKYQGIMKIKELVMLAETMEATKRGYKQPIELFLETMNSFIDNTEDEKKISINNHGEISFKTKYADNEIDIKYLSSGEKQLLIFFAYLIFEVDKNSKGIFVVDEPELSLHLSWQRQFVSKIREVNPNIQLIFATHAPEIIGANYDKMVELTKVFNKK